MENKLIKAQQNLQSEVVYHQIRSYVIEAQRQVYKAVNAAMVIAYWNIGKEIYELCGENDRAAYGKQVLKEISAKLSAEFGKGYDLTNLRKMKTVLLNISKMLHTVERIELVTLSCFNACCYGGEVKN